MVIFAKPLIDNCNHIIMLNGIKDCMTVACKAKVGGMNGAGLAYWRQNF